MKKRFLAMFCALSLLLTSIPFGTVFAAAEDNVAFRVGYAKVDINPWVDPEDHAKGIMVVPLDSLGNPENRFSFGLADDDGVAGKQDTEGLWSTCIAVTDDDDNTMLFISCDAIKVQDEIVEEIRTGIIAELGSDVIAKDQIMINASHSHCTPALAGFTEAGLQKAQGTELGSQIWANSQTYKARFIENAIAVAVEAMADRQVASEVKKTQVDASDVFVSDQYPNGIALNGVKHYINTGSLKENYSYVDGVETFDDVQTWYSGANFGCDSVKPTQQYRAEGLDIKTTYAAMGKYYIQSKEHVSESNDTMYMLEFRFDESLDKDTIMMANWRGHPLNHYLDEDADGNVLENPEHILYYNYAARSGNAGYVLKNRTHYISSDYVNAFRCAMKEQGYDVSFIQGAAGNISNRSYAYTNDENDEWGGNIAWDRFWSDGSLEETHGISTDEINITAFGKLLAEVSCNTEHKTVKVCTPGTIRSNQVRYALPVHEMDLDFDDPAVREAWTAAYKDAEKNAKYYPYSYTHTDGTVCTFASSYHVSGVKLRLLWRTGDRTQDEGLAKLELNAIMLGDDIAFVTAPIELFDNYDANCSTKSEDNDWLLLNSQINGGSYGTPFIMGYTNGYHNYLPNTLAFDYNNVDKGVGSVENVGVGAYETNISQVARGGGEMVVAEFGRLLQRLNGLGDIKNKTYYCPACNAVVEWQPLVASNNGEEYWYSGHYYLYEDMAGPETRTKRIANGGRVCLDLNGKTLKTTDREYGRAFVVEGTSTFSVIDSSKEKTGVISGQGLVVSYNTSKKAYTYQQGGAIYCQNMSTLNLYGGTIECRTVKDPYHEGSYNTSGGYYKYNEYLSVDLGGTIYMHPNATLNVYGGAITAGQATTAGNCVYSHSTTDANGGAVKLAGEASVSNIYFKSATTDSRFTVSGTYTGSADLTLQSAEKDQVVGKLTDAGNVTNALLTCGDLYVTANGTDLVLTDQRPNPATAVIGTKEFYTVQDAVEDEATGTIRLIADDPHKVTVPENKSVTIDLNGFDLQDVEVKGTLLVKDSKTDDYNVNDNDYGKITGTITGDVQAVPVTNGEGYLQVDEDEGVSFHKVHLSVTDMVMSASKVSIYYNCKFAGDEKVQGLVDQYGMAISLNGTPTVDTQTKTFTEDCQYSWFNDFKAGENKASSTRLYDIMKPDNGYLNNRDNANAPIYIRAYIKLKDGSYLLGRDYDRGFSLRNLLEAVNNGETWRALTVGQKEDLIELYRGYTRVYNGWSIDYLRNAANNKPMQLSQTEKEAFAKVVEFDLPENFRDALIDYMLECAEIEWVAKETYTTLQDNQTWSVDLTYNKGTVYHGIPYAAYTASAAQFSDAIVDGEYYPSKLGYLNEYGLGCTSSITLGFQQFVSYDGPGRSWLPGNKLFWFEKVGDYDTADSPTSSKTDICDLNGEQKMYEAYAQLQKGDIIFNVKDLSTYLYHARAVVCVPTVVRLTDGTIDPEQSYVTTIEASNKFDTTRTDGVNTTWQVNHQYTFANLYQKGYVPITLEAYSKDRTDMECPYVGLDTEITAEMLAKGELAGTIKSNFPILYASVDVLDENGSKVAYVENGNLYNTREVEVSSLSAVFDQLESGRTYTFVLKGGLARGTAELARVTFTYE